MEGVQLCTPTFFYNPHFSLSNGGFYLEDVAKEICRKWREATTLALLNDSTFIPKSETCAPPLLTIFLSLCSKMCRVVHTNAALTWRVGR